MYGWPPQGALQYRVKLASHERAAVVQRLAEFRWLPHLSFCYGVFVAGKTAESLFLSACRVTADSVTAVKGALIKPVYGKCREYNHRHQQSHDGRRDHADRQRAYRQRQADKKVTDQGSILPGDSGSVGVAGRIGVLSAMIHLMEAELSGVGIAKCCICGRWGELAR